MRAALVSLVVLGLLAIGCGDDEGDGGGGNADAADNGTDGGDDTPDGNGSSIDADPDMPDAPPAGPGIACGEATCDSETQECCVSFGVGGAATSTCVDSDTCDDTTVTCDGPEDCAGGGEACCFQGAGMSAGISCEQAQSCEIVVCHAPEDCPAEQPMCCDLGIFPTRVCAPQCGVMP